MRTMATTVNYGSMFIVQFFQSD